MQPAPWAMVLFLNPIGFLVPGQLNKVRYLKRTRNSSRLLWPPIYGVLEQWVSRRVEFLCDNESVVAVLESGTLQDKSLMVLLHYLTMLAIRHSFSFTASSVPGKDNPVADALSRFQFQRFRHLVPHADAAPSPTLASLLAVLRIPWLRSVSSFLPKV